jgi:flagellar hook assembly protein FlgD
LINVLTYTTGVEKNDTTFLAFFPYVQRPWEGTGKCSGEIVGAVNMPQIANISTSVLGLSTTSIGKVMMVNYPNPITSETTIQYQLEADTQVKIEVFNQSGALLATLVNGKQTQGQHQIVWNAERFPAGTYYARAVGEHDNILQVLKLIKTK